MRHDAGHDAVVIGGSFAGLSAALYIARARRRVCVLDAGAPRNRFAAASHGLFGQDGASPHAMLDTARAQLAAYPGVTFRAGEAVAARAGPEGFVVEVAGAGTLRGARLLLAFGVSDVLPDIPGLAPRWGRSVLHCPYCHGFEFSGRRLGVLGADAGAVHKAMLIAEWGPTTLCLNGRTPPEGARAALAQRGVAVEAVPVVALEGEGEALSGIRLADGRGVGMEALYVTPPTRLNSPIAARLGCALDDGPFGPVIRADAMKLTTVPGVYAAGDCARAPHSVAWAVADGVTAGVALHQSLAFHALAA